MKSENKEWLNNLSSELKTVGEILSKIKHYPDSTDLCETLGTTVQNISKSMNIIAKED